MGEECPECPQGEEGDTTLSLEEAKQKTPYSDEEEGGMILSKNAERVYGITN